MELFILIYQSMDGKYKWQLRNIQNKVIANSAESFATRKSVRNVVQKLKQQITFAQIQEV
ncbi:MAG: hypothetical protein KatS3mg089_0747 [Patescibacteria group bacterium]|nr:MAG: hypothetical protein KatS3mg089_0747 [Patescibacteria group bacterium]